MKATSRSCCMARVEQGKRGRLVVALSAVALLVGACGGSDGDIGGADGSEAPAAPTSESRTVPPQPKVSSCERCPMAATGSRSANARICRNFLPINSRQRYDLERDQFRRSKPQSSLLRRVEEKSE